MKKLLLIDGNAILHRAYHAYPMLTNSNAQPINAVYGFFTMLLLVIHDQKPDYLAICFDRGKPTIRQTMFAGYHEHRPKASDDFVSQIKIVHELLEAMKVQTFSLDGFEADDLIGTIAAKVISRGPATTFPAAPVKQASSDSVLRSVSARSSLAAKAAANDLRAVGSPSSHVTPREEVEIIILTGDRDLLQLVNGRVKILMPLVGITKTAIFDSQKVEEKYGVRPDQFIDYKALIGDQSDGYPGVTGIGPKTASTLLQKYETFENLYKNIGELPEKTGLMLATDAEQAALAKKLATIMTDVPLQFDITKCACSDFDIKALRESFRTHGFKSLLSRLDTMFGKEEDSVQLGLLD